MVVSDLLYEVVRAAVIGDQQYRLDRDYRYYLGDHPSERRTLRKFSPTVARRVGRYCGTERGRKIAVELGDLRKET